MLSAEEIYEVIGMVIERTIWSSMRPAELLEPLIQQTPLEPSGMSVAIAMVHPKAAALCHERIWGLKGDVPESIRFSWGTPQDVLLAVQQARSDVTGTDQPTEDVIAFRAALNRYLMIANAAGALSHMCTPNGLARNLASKVAAEAAAEAVVIYSTETELHRDFAPGDAGAIFAVLSQVLLPDEEKLSWRQVAEFRQDRDATKRYRRFVRWLNPILVGHSTGEVATLIEERYEAYRWALRKHGIQTKIAVLSTLVDEKKILAAAALIGSGFLANMVEPAFAVVASLSMGQLALEVARKRLELEDLRRSCNDIAFIYDLKKLIGES